METSYLKQHFGLRIYDIVGHIRAKLNAVVHDGNTRIANIKIKDGEDTYLAMRLLFDVEDESYLKEAKVYGNHAEGLLENGRDKFFIRLINHTLPFHRFATGIGSKVDFNPIFDALMVGNDDKEFTLHSDKNDSVLNGVAMISTMFIVKDYESSEGLSYVIKTVDETDFSGNGDVNIVLDAALAVNVSDAEEGEDNVLFTKAIVNKWRNNHYSWMLGNAAEKVYNSWKFTRFKCNIALSVDDMPDLKRVIEDKLGLFFTSLVCNQSYDYALSRVPSFLKLKENREESSGRDFTFKSISVSGINGDVYNSPLVTIYTEYGEKQGA